MTQRTTTELSAPHSDTSLISVYERPEHLILLWNLLAERAASQSISHHEMPTWRQHVEFVMSKPYEAWYFIIVDDEPVGVVYLTRRNEIGVFIFNGHQKKGHGRAAVKALMEKHGLRRYLANVNPANEATRFLFQGLGFQLCQHTYELRA